VDRLSVELQIDASAMDAAVPPLLLQPLVENAIRHGISHRMASGKVAVRAERQQERLKIEIRDDGIGLNAAIRLQEGVGLKNTRARLQQQHGNNFEFICVNAPQGGCQVTISIPYVALRAGKEAGHADAIAYRG
jgi:sensor histidine kinase YesM